MQTISFTFCNEDLTGINLSELSNITSEFKKQTYRKYKRKLIEEQYFWETLTDRLKFLKRHIWFKGFKKKTINNVDLMGIC